jgi:hypothetical protein
VCVKEREELLLDTRIYMYKHGQRGRLRGCVYCFLQKKEGRILQALLRAVVCVNLLDTYATAN